jgi:hypothetical protein
MSKLAGVPGMEGSTSPKCPPEVPDVVPNLLRDSEESWRFRFGGCFAAEERLRRWPAEAEKEFGEARAKDFNGEEAEAAWNGLGWLAGRATCCDSKARAKRRELIYLLNEGQKDRSKACSKGRVEARSREAVSPKTGRRFDAGCTTSMCEVVTRACRS